MEDGDQVLPFVRCFCGSPSTFLWEDEVGNPQDIPQGEGGENRETPLMPLVFALGFHRALSAVQARLSDDEKVFLCLIGRHLCHLRSREGVGGPPHP